MGPVFSLVLDTDLNEDLSLLYPELYAVSHALLLIMARQLMCLSGIDKGTFLVIQDLLHLGSNFSVPR